MDTPALSNTAEIGPFEKFEMFVQNSTISNKLTVPKTIEGWGNSCIYRIYCIQMMRAFQRIFKVRPCPTGDILETSILSTLLRHHLISLNFNLVFMKAQAFIFTRNSYIWSAEVPIIKRYCKCKVGPRATTQNRGVPGKLDRVSKKARFQPPPAVRPCQLDIWPGQTPPKSP